LLARRPLLVVISACDSVQPERGAMEKETFILQTTHSGRLPINAVFSDERAARAETERAQQSGAFEHIKLVHMIGTQKKVLVEIGTPTNPKEVATRSKSAAKGKPAPAKKKQVSNSQIMGRINLLITLALIAGVLYFAAQYFMTK